MTMNKGQLWTLIRVNMLYVNPQATQKQRQKDKDSNQIVKSLLMNYVLTGVLFIVIYGGMMLAIDFPKYPGFFTSYVTIFTIMALAQSVTTINNVFYESKDLKDYLPLPFSQSTVFTAKFTAVAITVLPFILPLLALFVVTAIRSGYNMILAVIIGLILFLLFFVLIFLVCSLFVFGLTQTKTFNRHRKMFTFLMIGITMIAMVVGIMYVNSRQNAIYAGKKLVDQTVIGVFLPLHQILVHPLSYSAIGGIIGILALIVLGFFLIKTQIIPRMYRTELNTMAAPAKKHRQAGPHASRNFTQQLLHYNMGLLKNATLMGQVLVATLLMPGIFLFSFAINGNLNLSQLGPKYLGVLFLTGIVLSQMTLNQSAIVANIISLDGDNYNFIKSLPISQRTYLGLKFKFATALQEALLLVVGVVIGFVAHLNWALILALLAGLTLGNYLGSLFYFYRDYRNLVLNWTNISQLFNRSGGNFAVMFLLAGEVFGGGIIIALYAIAMTFNFAVLAINVIFVILLVAVTFFLIHHYQWTFWAKLK